MPQVEKTRKKLIRDLEKERIKWQARVKKRWLANLLANKKAVTLLLRFLKATNVGGRKKARKQEKK